MITFISSHLVFLLSMYQTINQQVMIQNPCIMRLKHFQTFWFGLALLSNDTIKGKIGWSRLLSLLFQFQIMFICNEFFKPPRTFNKGLIKTLYKFEDDLLYRLPNPRNTSLTKEYLGKNTSHELITFGIPLLVPFCS